MPSVPCRQMRAHVRIHTVTERIDQRSLLERVSSLFSAVNRYEWQQWKRRLIDNRHMNVTPTNRGCYCVRTWTVEQRLSEQEATISRKQRNSKCEDYNTMDRLLTEMDTKKKLLRSSCWDSQQLMNGPTDGNPKLSQTRDTTCEHQQSNSNRYSHENQCQKIPPHYSPNGRPHPQVQKCKPGYAHIPTFNWSLSAKHIDKALE